MLNNHLSKKKRQNSASASPRSVSTSFSRNQSALKKQGIVGNENLAVEIRRKCSQWHDRSTKITPPWWLFGLRLSWHMEPCRTLIVLSNAKSPLAWQSKSTMCCIAEKQGNWRKHQLQLSYIMCRAGKIKTWFNTVFSWKIQLQKGRQGIAVYDIERERTLPVFQPPKPNMLQGIQDLFDLIATGFR